MVEHQPHKLGDVGSNPTLRYDSRQGRAVNGQLTTDYTWQTPAKEGCSSSSRSKDDDKHKQS